MRSTTAPKTISISTHAPLAGRDLLFRMMSALSAIFQPTRPLRGATLYKLINTEADKISTHAPLAGRDMGIGYELESEY